MSSKSPNSLLQTEVGVVARVDRVRPGAQELTVTVSGKEERAINYPALLGDVAVGEPVLLKDRPDKAAAAKLAALGKALVQAAAGG